MVLQVGDNIVFNIVENIVSLIWNVNWQKTSTEPESETKKNGSVCIGFMTQNAINTNPYTY